MLHCHIETSHATRHPTERSGTMFGDGSILITRHVMWGAIALTIALLLWHHVTLAQDSSWVGHEVVPKYDYPVKIGDHVVPHTWLPHFHRASHPTATGCGWSRAARKAGFLRARSCRTTKRLASTPRRSQRTPAILGRGLMRGLIWKQKKEYDKAIADFNEAIRLDPKLHSPTITEATPGTRRRSTTRPSPTSTRPSGSIPKYAVAYNNRGNAWQCKKDYDKAIADYNEAIRLDPKYAAPTSTGASPGATRRTTTRPSPTSTRPSGSIPKTPSPTTTAAMPGSQEGLRQGHRRLQRGHPARSEACHRLQQSGRCLA